MEEIDADDACVDAKHDKGVDAIYVDDVSETVYIMQAKTKTKDNAEFGDTEIKEFYGTLQQFDSKKKIDEVYSETKNVKLKTIERTHLASKVDSGYDVFGVFISNARANDDAKAILAKLPKIELFDAEAIANDYVDLDVDGGSRAATTSTFLTLMSSNMMLAVLPPGYFWPQPSICSRWTESRMGVCSSKTFDWLLVTPRLTKD